MRIRYAAKTDLGMRRTHNEDYFSLIEADQLFVVADGMGGHASGEVASKMAAEALGEFFEYTRQDDDATWPYKMDASLSYVANRLAVGIKLANIRIYDASRRDLRYRGMGTTIVAAIVSGDVLHIAHVGDSRAYRFRDSAITQLTRDHSLLEEYREAKPDMNDEELRSFPHKNVITRALGLRGDILITSQSHSVQIGDLYLLCTDGLSGMVADAEILEIVTAADRVERAVSDLIDAANRNGGNDNITALIIECAA